MIKAQVNILRRKLMSTLTGNVGERVAIRRNYSIKNNPPKRILLVRPNSRLGNQLMLTPLLQEIESSLPQCKVDIFVRGNLAPILFKNYPCVDRIIKLPSKPFKNLGQYINTWIGLRKYRYDLVFNVDQGSSSGRLCTRWVRGYAKFFGDKLLLEDNPDARHMAKWPVYNFRWFLQQVGGMAGNDDPKPLSLHLSEHEIDSEVKHLRQLTGSDKPVIMFFTYATGSKRLPREWWTVFFDKLYHRFHEHYNLVEIMPTAESVEPLDQRAACFLDPDVRRVGAMIHAADLFVTGDCGVMHLAAAVDVPVLALFSKDNREIYQPYNKNSLALLSQDIDMDSLLFEVERMLRESQK